MTKYIWALLFVLMFSVMAFAVGPFIGYVQVNPPSQQSGGFNLSTGTVAGLTVSTATISSGTISGVTIQTSTMTGQFYGKQGSVSAPPISFSADQVTGLYATADSSHTLTTVSSAAIVMTFWGDHQFDETGARDSHLKTGTRPGVYIGPSVMWSSGTQPGEELNVWTNTDGGGPQPQVDICSTNFGQGDARVLAQASMADTPNTSIAYMIGYGSGHGGNYWTSGPGFPQTVSWVSQAPNGTVFQMDASDTYFWMDALGLAGHSTDTIHFVHGATPAADDVTIAQGSMTVTGYFNLASKTKAQLQAQSPSKVGQEYYCSDCSTAVLCISSGTSTNQWYSSTSRSQGCQ